jgi:hypothetical protein
MILGILHMMFIYAQIRTYLSCSPAEPSISVQHFEKNSFCQFEVLTIDFEGLSKLKKLHFKTVNPRLQSIEHSHTIST